MGEGRLHVCSSRGPGSRLCPTRPPDDGPHLGGQPRPVCPQVSSSLAEEERGMGRSQINAQIIPFKDFDF